MNKSTILAVVLTLVCIFFCSCSINPYAFDWNLFGIYHDVTYVNGQTVLTWTSTGAYEHQPNGIHDGMVSIKFYEDGTVDFKPYDSEMLHGTYKLKHNGMKDTNFTVTFDNGERIENGYAVGYYYNDELTFEFRGIEYKFDTRPPHNLTKEEYDQKREDLADWIRRGGTSVRAGEVKLSESGAELILQSIMSVLNVTMRTAQITIRRRGEKLVERLVLSMVRPLTTRWGWLILENVCWKNKLYPVNTNGFYGV